MKKMKICTLFIMASLINGLLLFNSTLHCHYYPVTSDLSITQTPGGLSYNIQYPVFPGTTTLDDAQPVIITDNSSLSQKNHQFNSGWYIKENRRMRITSFFGKENRLRQLYVIAVPHCPLLI